MTTRYLSLLLIGSAAPLLAQNTNQVVDQLLNKVVAREQAFVETVQKRTPLIETYIQESAPIAGTNDDQTVKDHYFLGRFQLGMPLNYEPLVERTTPRPPEEVVTKKKKAAKTPEIQPFEFLPRGFVQMIVMDLHDFNRQTYKFDYVRQEFLGEVRCLVFDVTPLKPQDPGRFIGRIWVEDHDYSIVRFNGTYVNQPVSSTGVVGRYFHFDSWRVNYRGSEWIPANVYVEEEGSPRTATSASIPKFKAQTRIWDYDATPTNKLDELTNILVEPKSNVKDDAPAADASPLESQRLWERQAEDNILTRLEKGGFIAPKGPVDEVLNTVVNNLIVSANLNLETRCRVLLTTPLETFPINSTIVVSRGLIDVLPDEASLALVLADQLAYMVDGQRAQTQFAFNDKTMMDDATLLSRLQLRRTPQEIEAAAKKAVEIIGKSPYKNTAKAMQFLEAVSARSAPLQRLLEPNLGDQVATAGALLTQLRAISSTQQAPPKEDILQEIVALPLGSRVKLNPGNDQTELVKARPIALLSPRDKIPFEITPFVLNLTRSQVASTDSQGKSAAQRSENLAAPGISTPAPR